MTLCALSWWNLHEDAFIRSRDIVISLDDVSKQEVSHPPSWINNFFEWCNFCLLLYVIIDPFIIICKKNQSSGHILKGTNDVLKFMPVML